ncbi:hypothetical protein PRZ48_005208 [Zasmidium cellare]|uniref:F-box domain-containing protein n=1 Tax=Zasmidium cellare TaxID=395010 RepID=A0ABR0ES39_ZASCE|nr:hypothetical protein PRZ48_005208 [Zasmidium cellare]
MPKRLAVSLSDDPFITNRFKRPRTVWLGKTCFSYNRVTNKVREKTTFLDLPLELREQIYHNALEDVVQTINHPYDVLPTHDRFEAYLTLRLLNRQISAEVKSIWKKSYESRLVFYFDNPPELWDLWQEVEWHPRLRNAKFFLRSEDFDAEYGKDMPWNLISEDSEMLMEGQRGWNCDWVEVPGLWEHKPLVYYDGWNQERWVPEYHGFKEIRGTHDTCDGDFCKSYKKRIFPPLSGSIRLSTILWKELLPHGEDGEKVQEVGSLVMEGRARLQVYRREVDWLPAHAPIEWHEHMEGYLVEVSSEDESEDEGEDESEEESEDDSELEDDESDGEDESNDEEDEEDDSEA